LCPFIAISCSPVESSARRSSCQAWVHPSTRTKGVRRGISSYTYTEPQHVRRYATEPPKSGSNNTILYGLLGAGALGGGYYYLNSSNSTTAQHGAKNESGALGMPASKNEEKNIPAKAVAVTGVAPVKAFTGGDQGFISLLLESVENVSHNTKKFRFKLNDEDSTSGLPVASALLTKFKGPDMEKPVIRPYTPVSDEGMSFPPRAYTSAN